MTGEPIPANTTDSEPSGDLVPVETHSPIVRPAASFTEIEAAAKAYQELYSRLLNDTDFQTIGKRRFVKKSGWRKLALAFNVSFTIVAKDYERDDRGRIVRAEVTARAAAPNGRVAENIGACDIFERCCEPGYCTNRRSDHRHCQPGCPGTIHFSNPSHDLPATAETRAKNRAASDLFGMGEVSAEEINTYRVHDDDDGHTEGRPAAQRPAKPARPQPAAGPASEAQRKALNDRAMGLPDRLQDRFVKNFGDPLEITEDRIEAASRFVTALESSASKEAQ